MTGLELYSYSLLEDQLWYVAHPVHPTAEEVAAARLRLPAWSDVKIREMVVRGNIVNAKRWLAWLIRSFPTVTFIAPWIAALDGGGDDDLDPTMRARGLRDCCRTIRVCSGIVLVGGRVSGGMSEEKSHARAVVDLTFLGRVPPAFVEVNP